MAIRILMPALSPTMTEGNLVKWLKNEGDLIKSGETIAEIETDKAIMEIEAADTGILGKIIIPANTNGVKVNQLIALLLEKEEDSSMIDKIIKEQTINPIDHKKPVLEQNILKNELIQEKSISNNISEEKIFITPLAKKIANDRNIDFSQIKGSGPRGRIIKTDVLNLTLNSVSVSENLNEYKVIPHTLMRKTIARRLQESKQNIPHFYLTIDCNISNLIKLREEINNTASKDGLFKLSINDFIIKATAHALKNFPRVNSAWSNEGIIAYNNVDISIAVATDEGLITPIIKNADQKTLSIISNEVKELVKKAKENRLNPNEFQGGGFTISNLGMFGIREFQAIINPPQSAIFAIGAIEKKPIIINEQILIADIISVSISCDHRIIDGAVAAMFINEFKKFIEQPAMILI